MQVGIQIMFQNLDRGPQADATVVRDDLALSDRAVELGYESLLGS